MKDETISLYKQHASWHRYNYEQLQDMKKGLQECADLKEIADYGYALKRMAELVDDTRKELNKLCETAQHLQCAIQVEMGDISPVKTEYCTASAKVDFYAPVPKLSTDPEAYYDLCDEFGVSREAADCEAFRLHWPGVTELITRRMQKGEPVPKGIDPDQVKPKYSVTYRKKNGGDI